MTAPPMFRALARTTLARLLLHEGPSERAVALLESVLAGYEGMLPADHPRVVELRAEIEAATAR